MPIPTMSRPVVRYFPTSSSASSAISVHDEVEQVTFRAEELNLLKDSHVDSHNHETATAPLVTFDAYVHAKEDFPQTGVLGKIVVQKGQRVEEHADDPRLYFNTNAPLSAVVCGVQGSGKSHTVSVLLENCMIQSSEVGQLNEALSGVVFHFDSASGSGTVSPCEAAYLSLLRNGKPGVPVTVLVSPSNLKTMTKVYSKLPVKVAPLRFCAEDITANRLLALMLCDTGESRPLYVEMILGMMRDLGEDFKYAQFRQKVDQAKWQPMQKQALDQRLAILDVYLKGGNQSNNVKNFFKPGHLVIIDLTDPMVDGVTSSGLFDIILGLFMELPIQGGGRVVVLDEAHKYLDGNQGSGSRLTMSIESLIRQQRHVATRTIISTQEPTVVPHSILELASFVVIHRFASPAWAKHLDNHISVAFPGDNADESWFDKVVSLPTGHAIVFSPTAACWKFQNKASQASDESEDWEVVQEKSWGIESLGRGYIHIKSRARITADGGTSIMAIRENDAASNSEDESVHSSNTTSETSASQAPPVAHDSRPQPYPLVQQPVEQQYTLAMATTSTNIAPRPTPVIATTTQATKPSATGGAISKTKQAKAFTGILQALQKEHLNGQARVNFGILGMTCKQYAMALGVVPEQKGWLRVMMTQLIEKGWVRHENQGGQNVAWISTTGLVRMKKGF